MSRDERESSADIVPQGVDVWLTAFRPHQHADGSTHTQWEVAGTYHEVAAANTLGIRTFCGMGGPVGTGPGWVTTRTRPVWHAPEDQKTKQPKRKCKRCRHFTATPERREHMEWQRKLELPINVQIEGATAGVFALMASVARQSPEAAVEWYLEQANEGQVRCAIREGVKKDEAPNDP